MCSYKKLILGVSAAVPSPLEVEGRLDLCQKGASVAIEKSYLSKAYGVEMSEMSCMFIVLLR